jgi:hypothetical protein
MICYKNLIGCVGVMTNFLLNANIKTLIDLGLL